MACKFFDQYQGQEFYSSLISYVSSGPVAVFLVVADNAIEKMRALVGNEDPQQARLESPTSLRALYGKDTIHNAFHFSESSQCVIRDAGFFFTECREKLPCVAPNTAVICDSTCCIIKPHAVKEGLAGRIITDICAAKFKVVALEMFYLDRTHAEEFYEVYKGVLAEYAAMTEELALGPCYVLEIAGCSQETPKSFRSACGPMDPDLARKLRPQSLRARYGVDKVHNAIHCTDLPEDATMELEYFFRILTMKS
jgi:nucleoside-diphosphate kinase